MKSCGERWRKEKEKIRRLKESNKEIENGWKANEQGVLSRILLKAIGTSWVNCWAVYSSFLAGDDTDFLRWMYDPQYSTVEFSYFIKSKAKRNTFPT